MNDVVVSVAVGALAMLLVVALIVLDHRIHKLEEYCDKQRESFGRLRDSDVAREFKEWRKRNGVAE